MKLSVIVLVCLAALVSFSPALAQTKLSGTLTATAACPALQSIKKATNPGDVTLTVGTAYQIIGGNKTPPTHYWIVVPGANPDYRWVATNCGTTDIAAAPAASPAAAPSVKPATAGGATNYILAVSWEPAFCEGLPNKAECKAETASSPETTQLSLHGLWPQPRGTEYCVVSAADKASDKAHDWSALPAVTLSAAIRSALDAAMPGTQSQLERHEWIVHGTCYGKSQDAYFSAATTALAALNATPVRTLFADNIGKRLTRGQIRAAFDRAFGTGAGERVRIACETDGSRRLISELTIGLGQKVTPTTSLATSLLAAAPTDGGCDAGIVDPAGLQ